MRPRVTPAWSVPPLWRGETVFVIGGGVSVAAQPIARLAGRRVIAINSSYGAAPFAQFAIFRDPRWYDEHELELEGFAGQVIAVGDEHDDDRLCRLDRRGQRDGFSDDASAVLCEYTTFAAALNLAWHLGAARIVALGLDGKPSGGQLYHHKPHLKWSAPNWRGHRSDLARCAVALRDRGVEVINASPGSAYADLWAPRPLVEFLKSEEGSP